MAAHLKPLEKEDKISSMGTFTQVWNQSALKNAKKDADCTEGDKKSKDIKEQVCNFAKILCCKP